METVETLYRQYGPLVYRRCLAVLKDEEAAYDALQEVFVRLMNSPRSLERIESPVAYLFRAATNVSLNVLRKHKGDRFVSSDFPLEDLADPHEDPLPARMLLDLLSSSLSERRRAIVYCRYADGMALAEIAELFSISLSAVRKHLDAFKVRARRYKEKIL